MFFKAFGIENADSTKALKILQSRLEKCYEVNQTLDKLSGENLWKIIGPAATAMRYKTDAK